MAIKRAQGQVTDAKPTKGSPELPFNVKNIEWKPKNGGKGPFELSDSYGNLDHQHLLKFLNEHADGAVTSEGYYIWVFPDGKTIGRKLSNQVRKPNQK